LGLESPSERSAGGAAVKGEISSIRGGKGGLRGGKNAKRAPTDLEIPTIERSAIGRGCDWLRPEGSGEIGEKGNATKEKLGRISMEMPNQGLACGAKTAGRTF